MLDTSSTNFSNLPAMLRKSNEIITCESSQITNEASCSNTSQNINSSIEQESQISCWDLQKIVSKDKVMPIAAQLAIDEKNEAQKKVFI